MLLDHTRVVGNDVVRFGLNNLLSFRAVFAVHPRLSKCPTGFWGCRMVRVTGVEVATHAARVIDERMQNPTSVLFIWSHAGPHSCILRS